VPDYALTYLDFKADHFSAYYGDDENAELLRKNSSLQRQKSLVKTAQESKFETLTLGRGRKT